MKRLNLKLPYVLPQITILVLDWLMTKVFSLVMQVTDIHLL